MSKTHFSRVAVFSTVKYCFYEHCCACVLVRICKCYFMDKCVYMCVCRYMYIYIYNIYRYICINKVLLGFRLYECSISISNVKMFVKVVVNLINNFLIDKYSLQY